MECEKVREKFSSLLEKELNPLEEKKLREHLASCQACQKDFEQFEKTVNWLHSVKEEEVPTGFLTEIYQKMEDRKRMGPRQAWVHRLVRFKLPAQAVAMVAIVFFVLYLTKMMPLETPHEKRRLDRRKGNREKPLFQVGKQSEKRLFKKKGTKREGQGSPFQRMRYLKRKVLKRKKTLPQRQEKLKKG